MMCRVDRVDVAICSWRVVRRLIAAGTLATVAMIALMVAPPGALAASASYCVNDPACESAGGTSEPDVQSALTFIDGGDPSVPATLSIGPGSYTGPFVYFNNKRDLAIHGAGTSTILTVSGDGKTALDFGGKASDSVSQLAIRVTGGNSVTGLAIFNGTADHIDVATVSSDVPATGVNTLSGASLTHSVVEVPAVDDNANTSYAVLSAGVAIIQDDNLSAPVGIGAEQSSTVLAARDVIGATDTGFDCGSAVCSLQDSLITMTNDPAANGVFYGALATCTGASADLSLVNDNIMGRPQSLVGAVGCANPTNHANVTLDSSLLIIGIGGTNSLLALTVGGGGPATITPSYSDFDDTRESVTGAGASINVSASSGNINEDPACATRDCAPRYDSPLIDAGNPAALGFLDSPTDLAGQPRVVHGRRDTGAFEYQFRPPVAAITQDLSTATIGQTVHFNGDSSGDPDRGDTLTFDWKTDDGTIGNGSSLGHAFTTAGIHTINLTVTDPTGLSDSTTATVSVTAPGGGGGGVAARAAVAKAAPVARAARRPSP